MPSPRKTAPTPEAQLRLQAQALADLAMKTLESIMKSDGQDSVRLAAAREVLDRGHGRPKPGEPPADGEGLTVVVRRFTDAPDPYEVSETPEGP